MFSESAAARGSEAISLRGEVWERVASLTTASFREGTLTVSADEVERYKMLEILFKGRLLEAMETGLRAERRS